MGYPVDPIKQQSYISSCTYFQYTPMVPKTENGKTVLVKVGRPLTAANEHELRKKGVQQLEIL